MPKISENQERKAMINYIICLLTSHKYSIDVFDSKGILYMTYCEKCGSKQVLKKGWGKFND